MRVAGVAVAFTAVCLLSAASGILRAAPGTAKTTWDGVYTDAQARVGATLYADKCAECHGPDALGGNGPALTGAVFAAGWEGIALSDLFERMRDTAPATNPGSLNRDEVAALAAYILELNGFPSGPTELPSAVELLKPIRFVSANPYAPR